MKKTLDIEKQYEIGSEIILFSSRDELRELCKYYLNNPDKRALIANKAYIRAMRDHTYKSRFYEIIEDLKSEFNQNELYSFNCLPSLPKC